MINAWVSALAVRTATSHADVVSSRAYSSWKCRSVAAGLKAEVSAMV